MPAFDCISPLDSRYGPSVAPLRQYLSEAGFHTHKMEVEAALMAYYEKIGIAPEGATYNILEAADVIPVESVFEEEGLTKHDIRAMVNLLQREVHQSFRPYVHLGATSYDINEPANAARFRSAMREEVLPKLIQLERTLITLAFHEAETPQIGRTHGQWAVPITFGFAIAEYVSRLGNCITALAAATNGLQGKFSGAVGNYAATSLLVSDPLELEREVLGSLGLLPAEISTQIVPFEPMFRLLTEVLICSSVIANLARDMRNLQRSEIGEIGEKFDAKHQVGSSTMPQKQNPISFENCESVWKIIAGHVNSLCLDAISDHQRDLTGSASSRTYGEILAWLYYQAKRMDRTMAMIQVHHENMERNLMAAALTLGEPFYILFAKYGHTDAHEVVRRLSLAAKASGRSLLEMAQEDDELRPYLDKLTDREQEILQDPAHLYLGLSAAKAKSVCRYHEAEMGELSRQIAT